MRSVGKNELAVLDNYPSDVCDLAQLFIDDEFRSIRVAPELGLKRANFLSHIRECTHCADLVVEIVRVELGGGTGERSGYPMPILKAPQYSGN
jgi:hypothetical protein